MKIGYLKFCMQMELDFTNARVGNIEGRATLFKAIIDAGWDLTLYSQVTQHDEQLLSGQKDIANNYGIDNRWIRSIHYKPDKMIDTDTDLLMVENGPDNWMFRTRYGKQPFIRRCAEAMGSYSGLVFILGIHPDVPFPLDKLAYCDVPYHNKLNCYRKGTGSDPDHSWASYEEICLDKKLIFFNQAYNQEKYLDNFDRKRQGYRKHNVKFERLPILYGRWLLPEYIRDDPFKEGYKLQFVYLGYPRYREKDYRYWLFDQPFKVDSWGPWHKKANLAFNQEASEHGTSVRPFLPAQVMCTDVYWQANLSFGLISKKLQECGWVTHRTLETIHSGCILLGIEGVEGIDDYLDNDFQMSNRKELKHMVGDILNMSYKTQKRIWESQFEKIKKYDGNHMLKYLMKIYRRES